MDRSGANFFRGCPSGEGCARSHTAPIQIPIGAEETFKGVVDLVKMKAILWHDETMGAEYEEDEIPANLPTRPRNTATRCSDSR